MYYQCVYTICVYIICYIYSTNSYYVYPTIYCKCACIRCKSHDIFSTSIYSNDSLTLQRQVHGTTHLKKPTTTDKSALYHSFDPGALTTSDVSGSTCVKTPLYNDKMFMPHHALMV